MPERIQRKRAKGWRMPAGVKYVGRPGLFGNPFVVGGSYTLFRGVPRPMPKGHYGIEIKDPNEAVLLFARYLAADPFHREMVRAELAGHDLACWCSTTAPCHVDVLLVTANE